jgi:hypothetical protein
MNDAAIDETEAPHQSFGGAANSRRNAIRDGCRSVSEFPVEMQKRIDQREPELCAELKPKSILERELIKEMARAAIQEDVAHALLYDAERVERAVDENWDEDQRRHTGNLAARLPRDPQRVAGRLLETKQGVEWALEQWRGLAASAAENNGLTEPQRQLCLDLKGVSPLLRDNTAVVPAAGDKEGLLAVCAREMKHLETRLVSVLEGRDERARVKARRGQMPPPDAATRKYKSDEARAHKRWVWAFESFKWVRMGMPADTLIHPMTGRPLKDMVADAGGAPESPHAGTAAPQPVAGPDPDDREAGPDNNPNPPPEGISPEDQEMMLLVGATLRSMHRDGVLKSPGSAPPPT